MATAMTTWTVVVAVSSGSLHEVEATKAVQD